MALFLQENIEELNDNISIEEAYEGLIEASMDMQDLNEGLLQADFIIHEQCKVLTETEAENKKTNFLVKAVDKIIAFIKKVAVTIKNFTIKIKEKITNLFKKITGKMSDSDDILVPQGSVSRIEAIIEKIKAVFSSNSDKKVETKSKITELKKLISDYRNNKKSVNSTKEKVKFGRLKKIGMVVGGGLALSLAGTTQARISISSNLKTKLKEIENKEKDTSLSEEEKTRLKQLKAEVQQEIGFAKFCSDGDMSIAAILGEIGSMLDLNLGYGITNAVSVGQLARNANKKDNEKFSV